MNGCVCEHCGTPYGAAKWTAPFFCGRCRQLKAVPVIAPIVQFWDAQFFEVPAPERYEVAS